MKEVIIGILLVSAAIALIYFLGRICDRKYEYRPYDPIYYIAVGLLELGFASMVIAGVSGLFWLSYEIGCIFFDFIDIRLMHINPRGDRVLAATGRAQHGIDQPVLLREQFVPEVGAGQGMPPPVDF